MGLSFYGQIRPDKTVAKTTKKRLEEIDFPVVFKICVNPSFNETELEGVGYENMYMYFMGQSRFNGSIYGWSGHTDDGGVFSNASHIQDQSCKNVLIFLSILQI